MDSRRIPGHEPGAVAVRGGTARDASAGAPWETHTGTARVGTTVAHRFAASCSSVGQARRFLRAQFGNDDHHPDIELLALMLSELATNAVQHAKTAFEVDIWITPDAKGHIVLVCVSDDAPGFPVRRDPSTDARRGRGLRIVESLSAGWGVAARPDRAGKTVWFTAPVGVRSEHRAGPGGSENGSSGHAMADVIVGGGGDPTPPTGDAGGVGSGG